MRSLRDLFDIRFPTMLTVREQYFVAVCHRRCVLIAVIAFFLGGLM